MAYWKLTLSYDGTGFHGWQVQPALRTIQQELADAIERAVGERVLPQGSGRTDAGVHALAQVASFSMMAELPAPKLQRALNRTLPPSIRVLDAQIVDATFHARRSALAKTYEYRLFEVAVRAGCGLAQEKVCSPFLAPYVWDCRWMLDFAELQSAAAHFVGTHDFASFAASDSEKNVEATGTLRTIFSSGWTCEQIGGEYLMVYRVTGNGFLHHMVRNLVGTMVDAARGSIAADEMPRILAARDRSAAGPTAPARGLFLRSVEYAASSARVSA